MEDFVVCRSNSKIFHLLFFTNPCLSRYFSTIVEKFSTFFPQSGTYLSLRYIIICIRRFFHNCGKVFNIFSTILGRSIAAIYWHIAGMGKIIAVRARNIATGVEFITGYIAAIHFSSFSQYLSDRAWLNLHRCY